MKASLREGWFLTPFSYWAFIQVPIYSPLHYLKKDCLKEQWQPECRCHSAGPSRSPVHRPCVSHRQHGRLGNGSCSVHHWGEVEGVPPSREAGGKKPGLPGLLATSQGQQRMERQGNCPGKGSWQFYMVRLDLSASWNEVKYLNIWRASGKEKRSNGMLLNHRIG